MSATRYFLKIDSIQTMVCMVRHGSGGGSGGEHSGNQAETDAKLPRQSGGGGRGGSRSF